MVRDFILEHGTGQWCLLAAPARVASEWNHRLHLHHRLLCIIASAPIVGADGAKGSFSVFRVGM